MIKAHHLVLIATRIGVREYIDQPRGLAARVGEKCYTVSVLPIEIGVRLRLTTIAYPTDELILILSVAEIIKFTRKQPAQRSRRIERIGHNQGPPAQNSVGNISSAKITGVASLRMRGKPGEQKNENYL